jgi:hypothetical protein
VQALHDHSLVHFDLKPANIFLKGDVARLGDYGLSKLVTASRNSLSFGRGTPYYMAPEMLQRRGDARSDLYSLGIMLYECLYGDVPFRGDSEWEVLRKHETGDARVPAARDRTRPRVILRCLQKQPEDSASPRSPSCCARSRRRSGSAKACAGRMPRTRRHQVPTAACRWRRRAATSLRFVAIRPTVRTACPGGPRPHRVVCSVRGARDLPADQRRAVRRAAAGARDQCHRRPRVRVAAAAAVHDPRAGGAPDRSLLVLALVVLVLVADVAGEPAGGRRGLVVGSLATARIRYPRAMTERAADIARLQAMDESRLGGSRRSTSGASTST